MSGKKIIESYVPLCDIHGFQYCNKFTLIINKKGNIILYYSYYDKGTYLNIVCFKFKDNIIMSDYNISKIEYIIYIFLS